MNITKEGKEMSNKKNNSVMSITDIIIALIKKYPNDADLGEKVRLLFKKKDK